MHDNGWIEEQRTICSLVSLVDGCMMGNDGGLYSKGGRGGGLIRDQNGPRDSKSLSLC